MNLVRQIEQALADLRAIVPERPPNAEAEEAARADRARRLSLTMSEDHIRLVNDVWTAHDRAERSDPGPERLAAVVRELLHAAEAGLTNFKLALPPVVADTYLSSPNAHPFEQCRDCGLVLPLGPEYWLGTEHHPLQHWFDRCPECGGRIGEWDKWGNGPTLPTPAEKRAALAERLAHQ